MCCWLVGNAWTGWIRLAARSLGEADSGLGLFCLFLSCLFVLMTHPHPLLSQTGLVSICRQAMLGRILPGSRSPFLGIHHERNKARTARQARHTHWRLFVGFNWLGAGALWNEYPSLFWVCFFFSFPGGRVLVFARLIQDLWAGLLVCCVLVGVIITTFALDSEGVCVVRPSIGIFAFSWLSWLGVLIYF